MTKLRVIGAGLGRTGTNSLKVALEMLLGGRCYHMLEVFEHPEHVKVWHDAAVSGETAGLAGLLDGYVATVDWPSTAFWAELAEGNPEALVLLSTRSVDSWWKSFDETILAGRRRRAADPADPFLRMTGALFSRNFTPDFEDEESAKRAFLAHEDRVRKAAPADRFLEWHPGDGWEPICRALSVPVPKEPFPHVNTTDEFRKRARLD
ncbi:MAG TPA: sulfotransferase [Polyangiaceae bacterium]|nr:sulfotransferase [Polyangiaceae bacterium]